MLNLRIDPKLKKLPTIDYRKLVEFQGELKTLTRENYDKMVKSFNDWGFFVPLFIWNHDGVWKINDGHQRVRVLKQEEATPHELPYVEIAAADEIEAKKKLLVISSQFGTVTQEGLDSFSFDIPEDWLKTSVKFDGIYDLEPANDPEAEWEGMPEYKSEDAGAYRDIIIHFKDQAAVDLFAKTTKQLITADTKYLWFPEIEIDKVADLAYKSEK
jgi:hypothetical protein